MLPKNKKRSPYEKSYLPAQKYLTVNDGDPDLTPITIQLPKPPDIRYIEGYGKAPEDQYFYYPPVPEKLRFLEESCYIKANKKYQGRMVSYMTMELFWESLNNEQEHYAKEIEYIKKTHWHLEYGYWCFILGTPTWITPTHLFYLSFYYANKVANNKIDYRDEDRIRKIFDWWCWKDTWSFKDFDKDGYPVKIDGKYRMEDLKRKVCAGIARAKRRRAGESMDANSDGLWVLIKTKEAHVVSQAQTGIAAQELYEDHTKESFKRLTLFLKPVHSGDNELASGIYCTPPQSVQYGKYTNGWFQYNNAAYAGVNDRKKIDFLIDDEPGKVTECSVDDRWRIDKLTLMQNAIIHGFSKHISTVEEMNAGGEAFNKMCENSAFYGQYMPNRQTISGLRRLFRSVYYGSDGFIDQYGFSVIDTPTELQLKNPPINSLYATLGIGSRQYWDDHFGRILSDPKLASDYAKEARKNPRRYADCWQNAGGDMGFDYMIIATRRSELRNVNPVVVGNFEFTSGIGSDVVFNPTSQGKWIVSDLLQPEERNQWMYGQNIWDSKSNNWVESRRPKYPSKRTSGADPFDYSATSDPVQKKEFRLSEGGGAVVEGNSPQNWRVICTYLCRTSSLEKYALDMMKQCIYFGSTIAIERNKTRLIEYFIDNGMGGYLGRLSNPDGSIKPEYGIYAGTGTINELFNCIRDYISFQGMKCDHDEILADFQGIKDPKQLRRYDRVSAVGWALYMSLSKYSAELERVYGIGASPNSPNEDSWYTETHTY